VEYAVSSEKTCLLPQAILVSEAQRIIRAAAETKGGEKVKAQIRNAAKNLGIEHDMALRAWHGRIGSRAFPTLYDAWRRYDDRSKALAERELTAMWERLDRVEQAVASLTQHLKNGHYQVPRLVGEPASRSRLR
jgi:hypothetical protein